MAAAAEMGGDAAPFFNCSACTEDRAPTDFLSGAAQERERRSNSLNLGGPGGPGNWDGPRSREPPTRAAGSELLCPQCSTSQDSSLWCSACRKLRVCSGCHAPTCPKCPSQSCRECRGVYCKDCRQDYDTRYAGACFGFKGGVCGPCRRYATCDGCGGGPTFAFTCSGEGCGSRLCLKQSKNGVEASMSYGCTPKTCGACGVVRCRRCVTKCYQCKAWRCGSDACADCGLHGGKTKA